MLASHTDGRNLDMLLSGGVVFDKRIGPDFILFRPLSKISWCSPGYLFSLRLLFMIACPVESTCW